MDEFPMRTVHNDEKHYTLLPVPIMGFVEALVLRGLLEEIEHTYPRTCKVCSVIMALVSMIVILVGVGVYFAYPGIRCVYHAVFYESVSFVVDLTMMVVDLYLALFNCVCAPLGFSVQLAW